MPIIDTPAGTLEVTNAILSASEFRATQKISVSNSAPTKNFSVGDKFHVRQLMRMPLILQGTWSHKNLKSGIFSSVQPSIWPPFLMWGTQPPIPSNLPMLPHLS